VAELGLGQRSHRWAADRGQPLPKQRQIQVPLQFVLQFVTLSLQNYSIVEVAVVTQSKSFVSNTKPSDQQSSGLPSI
jgi:hypothetical protein